MTNNRKVKYQLINAIVIGYVINILILCSWFFLRIRPLYSDVQNIKDKIFTEDIKTDYPKMEDLKKDLTSTSSKYELIINLSDASDKLVIKNDVKYDIPLITKIVKVDNNPYLIKIYFDNYRDVTKSIIELLIIEIIIVIIILLFVFIYARKILLKPINLLIDDIRNYKFGKKPKKRVLNNEFDLISNEFSNLTDKLDEEKREQTRIIASISHDIKTPLTSIIGYSDLLKDLELDEEALKYNSKIYDKAIDIKEILSNFDDYLLNQEKITLDSSLVQVKDIVKQLNDDYKIELENNNIKFEVTTKIPDVYLNIDVLKMKRVFSNMISNSTRYLSNGGEIKIDISLKGDNVKFIVRDNGPGVLEEIIDKIFNPLFTTDSSRKISGLGLSICKEFIEMHGGTLKAYNDKGLVLEFLLPKVKKEKKEKSK